MSLPFRRRSRPRGAARLALTGDIPGTSEASTEILEHVRPADYDGRTYEFTGASDIGQPDADRKFCASCGDTFDGPACPNCELGHPGIADTRPVTRLRARPPQQPPPAGYSATTGPMPAIGRLTPAIGDALTHDEKWGPKLAPLPCGHCGTPPPVPGGILERTRIIGHVNWLAAQAGWRFDYDMTWTCPPCQQDEAWRARQGQVEVRWPDGGVCMRHDDGTGDRCDCPSAVLATDVMLTSHDYLRTGRDISIQILKDTQAGGR